MSTEPNHTDSVRSVLLSILLVLSIVGGATAIAGQTVADGSLSDGVDETVDDSEDDLENETTDDETLTDDEDSPDETDTVTDTDDSLTDDEDATDEGTDGTESGADLTDAEESTDETETVTDSDESLNDTTDSIEESMTESVDTSDVTATVEDTADSLYVAGLELRATDRVGMRWFNGLVITSESNSSSSDSASSTSGGDASPTSVGITASAENQAPIATAGEGPATLRFSESESGAFPDNGTTTLSLPAGSEVAFDTDATSASVTVDGGSASLSNVTGTTIAIEVSSTDENMTTTLSLDGVRFTSGGNASTVDATWSYGNESAVTAVEPEYLTSTGFGNDLPRGADGAGGGFSLGVEAPGDARTQGFVAATDHVGIRIPEEHQAKLSFDQSVDPEVYTESGDCGMPIISDPIEETHWVDKNTILIELSCEIGQDEYLRVEGVKFNVSGADAGEPAEFTSQLDVDYQPVNMTDQPTIDGGEPVSAHAPIVSAGSTTVETNVTNTTGDGGLTVSLADDIGGLLGDGTRITLALQDTGVTFNESQTFDPIAVSGDTPGPTVVSANATTIVMEVDGPTEAGDEFRIQRSGGKNISFDVAADANDTALEVTTTPGAEDVTQVTETVVSVDQQTCRNKFDVITDMNGEVSLRNMSYATQLWQDADPVPGTCGARIGLADINYITQIWQGETEYES